MSAGEGQGRENGRAMSDGLIQNSTENSEKYSHDDLTRIRDMYTLSPTQNAGEVDKLMIKQFLDVLADVAIAVAARKIKEEEYDDEVVR